MKKIMKTLGVALLSCTAALSATAQTMTVTTNAGDKHTFNTSDVKEVSFDGFKADAPFDIEISKVTTVSARLDIKPANPALPYYFDVCTKADMERIGSVSKIVENYFDSMHRAYPELTMQELVEAVCSIGDDGDTVNRLPSDTDMVCYVIGVNYDGQTVGESATKEFRTLKGGNPEDCTFEISYSGLGATQLAVIIEPSDPSIRYWYGIYSVFDYPGDAAMPMLVKNTINEYADQTGMSVADIVRAVTYTGPIMQDESGLEAGKTYYIYAYAMDDQGNAAGPVFKENFTTALQDYSDAELQCWYRYFDGDALAEKFPDKFANAKGKVLVQPVFTPNELTMNYVWALAAGDYTNLTMYPDQETRQAMLGAGYVNIPTKNLIANWGEATFLYYGSDMWGVDGKLFRLLADFKPEGAAPAETYYDLVEAPAKAAPSLKLRAKTANGFDLTFRKKLSKLYDMPASKRDILK